MSRPQSSSSAGENNAISSSRRSGRCHVSAYIESKPLTAPSINQHLAALRGLFNWLVIKQVVPDNPALFVKGPKFGCKIGVTPIMEAKEVRLLLDSIPVTQGIKVPKKLGGGYKDIKRLRTSRALRDRAGMAIMVYTFARVSAVVGLARGDYRLEGKRARLRLLEKGGKEQLVWLHHEAEGHLDAYIAAAGTSDAGAPLFPSLDKAHKLTGEAISIAAGLSEAFCNHSFLGTGMTVFLSNGGSLEAAQDLANHADPRTTKLYDRRNDLPKLSEIERRIAFE